MKDTVCKKEYLPCGIIVGTHGVQGGVRVESWCDSPDVLAGLSTLYMKKNELYFPVMVKSSFVKKNNVVLFLEGTDSVEAAAKLKGCEFFGRREDISGGRDVDFIADLLLMNVYNFETGELIGILSDVIMPSFQQIYVVEKEDKSTFMVPAVPEFIKRISYGACEDNDYSPCGIYIKMIDGLD